MARYTGPVCRLCRRENMKLFLKGQKCYSEKCAMVANPTSPGQHGARRKKLTEYGVQHREKQKTRRFYGVLEGQFAKYFEMANKMPGMTGNNLLSILETRLDNVVYRLGFALSRAEARQIVRHGHILVNGKKVNIPSYLVKAGEVISIKEKSLESAKIKSILEINDGRPVAKWLDLNKDAHEGKVLNIPTPDDVELPIEVHLIVELYSK